MTPNLNIIGAGSIALVFALACLWLGVATIRQTSTFNAVLGETDWAQTIVGWFMGLLVFAMGVGLLGFAALAFWQESGL